MTPIKNYRFDALVSGLLADAVVAAKTIKQPFAKTQMLSRLGCYYAAFKRERQARKLFCEVFKAAQKFQIRHSQQKSWANSLARPRKLLVWRIAEAPAKAVKIDRTFPVFPANNLAVKTEN